MHSPPGSRGSPARPAATPWPWPSRFSSIAAHAWGEPVQPPAEVPTAARPSVVPAPHFDISSVAAPPAQREAG